MQKAKPRAHSGQLLLVLLLLATLRTHISTKGMRAVVPLCPPTEPSKDHAALKWLPARLSRYAHAAKSDFRCARRPRPHAAGPPACRPRPWPARGPHCTACQIEGERISLMGLERSAECSWRGPAVGPSDHAATTTHQSLLRGSKMLICLIGSSCLTRAGSPGRGLTEREGNGRVGVGGASVKWFESALSNQRSRRRTSRC